MFQRYAIYYTPDQELAHLGAAWLGWDLVRGAPTQHPDFADLNVASLTNTPRKYGMHGTIKPPFHLRDGAAAADLQEDFRALCSKLAPVSLSGLEAAQMGRFIALVPECPSDALSHLASQVVSELDSYRAQPSDAELARRRRTGLTAAQDANLTAWGYPYVMDQFRFHITLTGRLDMPAEPVLDALQSYFPADLLRPFMINSLTLVGQTENGFFHEIVRFHLKG